MSSSDIFIGETIGTAVLVLLGGGVCAAVTLRRSKAHNAGWLAITFGWGFAVLTGAYIASGVSGAHLNPAVTIGLAIQGGTAWGDVPLYLASELLGAIIGAVLVWAVYYGQFHAHLTDPEVVKDQPAEEGMVDQSAAPKAGPVLGIFTTGPRSGTGCRTSSRRSSPRSCSSWRSSRRASTTRATASVPSVP